MNMSLKVLKILWIKREIFLRVFIFFYGGESESFYRALEFIGLSPMKRDFGAFLMSELGQQVMTENKLSIHLESGI